MTKSRGRRSRTGSGPRGALAFFFRVNSVQGAEARERHFATKKNVTRVKMQNPHFYVVDKNIDSRIGQFLQILKYVENGQSKVYFRPITRIWRRPRNSYWYKTLGDQFTVAGIQGVDNGFLINEKEYPNSEQEARRKIILSGPMDFEAFAPNNPLLHDVLHIRQHIHSFLSQNRRKRKRKRSRRRCSGTRPATTSKRCCKNRRRRSSATSRRS